MGSEGPKIRAVFSDLDGTLIHFPVWFEKHGVQVLDKDELSGRGTVRNAEVCHTGLFGVLGAGILSAYTQGLGQ